VVLILPIVGDEMNLGALKAKCARCVGVGHLMS
jgi:hypothetical protein